MVGVPDFVKVTNYLIIRGGDEEGDGIINICTAEEKALIEDKVKAINLKYGIKKRWRADYESLYYYINNSVEVIERTELYYYQDKLRYEMGNYFRTKEEALEYAEYMKQKSLEWHEIRGRE